MYGYSDAYCYLATTSVCPSNCRGPYDTQNIQRLDTNGQCGSSGRWNGGCFMKQGW